MSNDKYFDDILAFITEHGESGVNAIAKGIGVPLSTIQVYLTKQTYFKKTDNRKWELPEKVIADIQTGTLPLMVNSVENALLLLKAHLTELSQDVDNALMPVDTLKRGLKRNTAPVADKSDKAVDIHPRLIKADEKLKEAYVLFKKYLPVVPEQYRELIKNVDLVALSLELGSKYASAELMPAISDLFLEKTDILDEEIIELLKEYQKEN